jgi:14-3-3 protein beta/theta/zeta
MLAAMKRAVETDSELTNEERNLLSVAYKNVVGAYRSSWRVMPISEQNAEGSECKRQMIKEYREKIESHLKERCYEILVRLIK